MHRVAIYGHDLPGRAGTARLGRQVARLAGEVARRPDCVHVATYADQGPGAPGLRPGLSRLLAEAPGRVDLVVVDDYRPALDRPP
jgi:DNA invertase Pin-like site-specific DNA recombinase